VDGTGTCVLDGTGTCVQAQELKDGSTLIQKLLQKTDVAGDKVEVMFSRDGKISWTTLVRIDTDRIQSHR
jgi:hypothetical protein